MTKYKDFIPHTKYKYSISKYCNKNTILRKMFNSQIYKYILILWIIIDPFLYKLKRCYLCLFIENLSIHHKIIQK